MLRSTSPRVAARLEGGARALGFRQDPIAEELGSFAQRDVQWIEQIETLVGTERRRYRTDQRAARDEILRQSPAAERDPLPVQRRLDQHQIIVEGKPAL